MKRIVLIIMVLILAIGLGGCANNEKQESLLQYINNDVIEMGEIETKLIESYGSVTGENYINDNEMYEEFTEDTINLARELNDKAVELAFNIEDDEILEVHRLYMDYSNKFLNVIVIMISALENQDSTQIAEANEKLNEANNLALDYKKELNSLAKKYNVEIEDK